MNFDELRMKLDQLLVSECLISNPEVKVSVNLELSDRSVISLDLNLEDIEFISDLESGKDKGFILLKF